MSAARLVSPPQSPGNLLRIQPVEVLRVPLWSQLDWLVHGFSTRQGGVSSALVEGRTDDDLNLGYTADDQAESVTENRRRFVEAVHSPFMNALVTIRQMHSSLSRRVSRADVHSPSSIWGDGLMTNEPGVLLGIQTADCLPILIADKRHHAVGAFHAGWRGTVKAIVEKGIRSMGKEFGSRPEDLMAAIGPGIGSCCFAVGEEVRKLFTDQFAYAEELFLDRKGVYVDLVEANRLQLIASGLAPESIYAMRECTSCQPGRFFSYRGERGKTGRMMAVIGIKSA